MFRKKVTEIGTSEPKKEKVKKTKEQKGIAFKRAFLIFVSAGIVLMSSGLFILYGPFSYVRETLITTAMTTMTHQWLCKWFYSDDTIASVLANNTVIESGESTDPNLITISNPDYNATTYANQYEKEILDREEGALYKVIDIEGPGYKGFLVAVYDPSKVHIATTKYLGKTGQSLKVIAKNSNAIVAMNASGFYDPDWNSNGAIPHGVVISNGKVVWRYDQANVGGGFIGFTNDDKFVLCACSEKEALKMGMRDAIQFGPFLIVNGKPSFVKGNGGWGIAPRSAIGQRQDGIVLFLVINGRRTESLGADMVNLTEIMQNYGAYNAANLDGGSSSALVINNEIVNTPVAGGAEGLRNIPTAWVVTED